jgi:5,6-dimethylbenzimidazole synthase
LIAPTFDEAFRRQFAGLLQWRRDVRHFREEPLAEADVQALLDAAHHAPSVGNSQPWRIVRVATAALRDAVADHVDQCVYAAGERYRGMEYDRYRSLKLHGIRQAPLQLAVFCDHATDDGQGLGRATMPETLDWSVVMAIHSLWLAAVARGLGVGWVSILEPVEIARMLAAPPQWRLIAWLCIGRAIEPSDEPELAKRGWQQRLPLDAVLFEK